MPITQDRMLSLLLAAEDLEQQYLFFLSTIDRALSQLTLGTITLGQAWEQIYGARLASQLQMHSLATIHGERAEYKHTWKRNERNKLRATQRRVQGWMDSPSPLASSPPSSANVPQHQPFIPSARSLAAINNPQFTNSHLASLFEADQIGINAGPAQASELISDFDPSQARAAEWDKMPAHLEAGFDPGPTQLLISQSQFKELEDSEARHQALASSKPASSAREILGASKVTKL